MLDISNSVVFNSSTYVFIVSATKTVKQETKICVANVQITY